MTDSNREAWLKWRRSGLGGTDTPAIMGLSHYKGPYEVYLEKTGLVAKPIDNPFTIVGRAMEKTIAKMFSDEYDAELVPGQRLRSSKHEWMLGSTDFHFKGQRKGLDCKLPLTQRSQDKWGTPDTDEIPIEYWGQGQHYLALTGYECWYFAALLPRGDDVVVARYCVYPDAEYQARMIETCSRFWHEHVLAMIPPLPTHTAMTREYLKARHPDDNGETLIATPEVAELAKELWKAKADESKATKRADDLAAQVKWLLGDASELNLGALGKITYKKARDGQKIDYPEVVRAIMTRVDLRDDQLELVTDIIAEFTRIEPGSRRLLTKLVGVDEDAA